MMVDFAKKLLVPSWWEIQVSLAAAAFIICVYCFFSYQNCVADDRKVTGDSADKQKVYSHLLFSILFVFWLAFIGNAD